MQDMGLDESLVKWMVSFMAVHSVIMSADKTADPWIVASTVGDSFDQDTITPLLESLYHTINR